MKKLLGIIALLCSVIGLNAQSISYVETTASMSMSPLTSSASIVSYHRTLGVSRIHFESSYFFPF